MSLFTSPQDFDHLLDPISGFDGMHDLQYHAGIEPGQVWNRGALVSLNANGNLITGLGAVDSRSMPLFALNATADFDVASEEGNIAGGVVATYPATGGYELVTTEYDQAPTYAPNDPLIHDVVTAGFVTQGTVASPLSLAESIVGVVSFGERIEVYSQAVLQFWPVYLPAREAGAVAPVIPGTSSSG